MVYVLDIDGHPLMPTRRSGKVRRMLNDKQAKVVKRCPFTIQLLYKSTTGTQPVSLGIDAGSRQSGFFDIRTLSGDKVNKGSISCKKLQLVEKGKFMLTERRAV